MRSRLAARVVTGPVGFLVAGAIDVTLLWGEWAARTAYARLRGRAPG